MPRAPHADAPLSQVSELLEGSKVHRSSASGSGT
jgi:hypothetical protein